MARLTSLAFLCVLLAAGGAAGGIIDFTGAVNGDGVDLDSHWLPPGGILPPDVYMLWHNGRWTVTDEKASRAIKTLISGRHFHFLDSITGEHADMTAQGERAVASVDVWVPTGMTITVDGWAGNVVTKLYGTTVIGTSSWQTIACDANQVIGTLHFDGPYDGNTPIYIDNIDAVMPDPSYSLTVVSGSGSGIWTVGQVVAISADSPATGMVFRQWAGETGFVADVQAAGTTVTMGAADVAITATYTHDGDLNRSGAVDIVDLNMVLIDWGKTGSAICDPRTDVYADGIINIVDLNVVLIDWGKTSN